MSIYWNERVRSLSPYIPGEQPRDRRYIKLNTNENPYPPSPATLAAIREAADKSLRLYPDPGSLDFRRTIAERYDVACDQVFAGNGSDEILGFAFGAFFKKDEAIVFPDISYSFYPVYAKLWEQPYKQIALDTDFTVRIEDYLHPYAGVVLPNPNAPTGIALSAASLLEIVEYQRKAGKVVIVDEAYVDFGAESLVSAVQKYPNLLVVHTLSKFRSLAGLRVGYAIGQRDLIEALERIRDSFNSYTMDRCAQAGAAAAIRDDEYYRLAAAKIIETRGRITAELRSLGYTVLDSCSNFFMARHPRLSGEKFFLGLRERSVLVRYFKQARIAEFVRVSVGTDAEMDDFLDACKELK